MCVFFKVSKAIQDDSGDNGPIIGGAVAAVILCIVVVIGVIVFRR
jgi:hypothetical protein